MISKITRPQIREVFLRNGAVIPADRDDLPDYVYESVFELMELAAPAVQGEPVEYQCHSCRKTTPPPAPFKAYVECGECGALTAAPIAVRLAAPQPAEPDVAGLVEALEQCITSMLDSGYRVNAVVIRAALDALDAYRKGAES